MRSKQVLVFLFAFLLTSLRALGEDHGAAPGSGRGTQADVFSGVGKSEGSFRKELLHCHIVCGPNKDNYSLDYLCDSKEGAIFRKGSRLKTFPICRTAADIVCGGAADGFVIRQPGFDRGSAQYKYELLGGFYCQNK